MSIRSRKNTVFAGIIALMMSVFPVMSTSIAAADSASEQLIPISCNVFAAEPWNVGSSMYAGGYASCDQAFSGTFYWSLVYAQPGPGADPRVPPFPLSYHDFNSNFDANNYVNGYACGGSVPYYSAVTIESDDGAILISDYSNIVYLPYCYYD